MTGHLLVLDPGQIGPEETISAVLDPSLGEAVVVDPLGLDWPVDRPPTPRQRAVAHVPAVPGSDGVIVAHCTNAVVALELAALVGPDRVVLFAPVRVTPAVVAEHTRRLLVALTEPAASAESFARQVWDGTTPVGVALRTTFDRFRAVARADASDLDEREADRFVSVLCGRYERWLGHLAGQLGAVVPGPTCQVDVVDTPSATDFLPTGLVRRHDCVDPYAFGTWRLRHLFRDVLAVPASGRSS